MAYIGLQFESFSFGAGEIIPSFYAPQATEHTCFKILCKLCAENIFLFDPKQSHSAPDAQAKVQYTLP